MGMHIFRWVFLIFSVLSLSLGAQINAFAERSGLLKYRPGIDTEGINKISSFGGRSAQVENSSIIWNTFLGSGNNDFGNAVAVDSSGNIYVVGQAHATWGTPINPYGGGYNDVYVAKFNSSGAPLWHTFMGSGDIDDGLDIAVDSAGNAYVIGNSFASWGTPVNPFVWGGDIFVAKLNTDGIRQWNTFIGSGHPDYGQGIALDSSGNIYIVGFSKDWGTPVNAHAGGWSDVLVAKLNSDGVRQWHTFMGSPTDSPGSPCADIGHDIAVDSSSDIFVTGICPDWGTPINAHAGGSDVFVAKLNSDGIRQWHTFMGSSGNDEGQRIALDSIGNIYVTGESSATWGVPVNAYVSGLDILAAKLDSSGVRQWHTFLGSTGTDHGKAIAVDPNGDVYVGGDCDAAWGSEEGVYAGGYDAYAAKLNSDGILQWNNFVGSTAGDYGRGLAFDGNRTTYLFGHSNASWGTPINAYTGNLDAFIAKLANNPTITTTSVSAITTTTASSGGNVTSDGESPVTARGVCWSTLADPTTADSKTTDGTGTGTFVSSITGLSPGTAYHVRAYATNSVGTSYGENRTFTTAVPLPEMNIKYDSTSIPDGGGYDFGSHDTGTHTDNTFTIENTGTADLTLGGTPIVTIGGTNADQFSIQQQPSSPVAPAGSTTFVIRFSPTSSGAKTASISIANNDADENPYDIALLGAGHDCEGDISIPDISGTWGDKVHIPVHIANNVYSFSAFGYDFVFDPQVLEFKEIERCAFLDDWSNVSAVEVSSGRLRVGGMAGGGTPVPSMTNGCLVTMKFMVKCTGYVDETPSAIQIEAYVDGILKMCPNPFTAEFLYRPCPRLGDVSGDGTITPADAQLAFEIYLGKHVPSTCQLTTADANCSCPCSCKEHLEENLCITPSDAQWIFEHYMTTRTLPLCCTDYTCPVSSPDVRSSEYKSPPKERTVYALPVIGNSGQRIMVPVVATNPHGICTFGFEISYPDDMMDYVGVTASPLTSGFEYVRGTEGTSGLVRIEAKGMNGIAGNEDGPLAVLVFDVKEGTEASGEIVLHDLRGDLIGDRSQGRNFVRRTRFGPEEKYIGFGGFKEQNGLLIVPVEVSHTLGVKAFGFDVNYSAETMVFVGINRTDLTKDYKAVDGKEIEDGVVRIGGYDGSGIQAKHGGVLVELVFRVKDSVGKMEILNTVDDLRNYIIMR